MYDTASDLLYLVSSGAIASPVTSEMNSEHKTPNMKNKNRIHGARMDATTCHGIMMYDTL